MSDYLSVIISLIIGYLSIDFAVTFFFLQISQYLLHMAAVFLLLFVALSLRVENIPLYVVIVVYEVMIMYNRIPSVEMVIYSL